MRKRIWLKPWAAGAALLAAGVAPGAAAFRWGPALQCLGPRSVWIMWEGGDGSGIVTYAEAGGTPREAREQVRRGRTHRVRLGDLVPGTRYTYRCGVEGDVESADGSFTTPPGSGATETTFLVCTDTGEVPEAPTGNLEILIETILEERPDFVLNGGDLSEGTALLEEGYLIPWTPVMKERNVYTAFGNHDGQNGKFGPYVGGLILRDDDPDDRTELYYAFDWGPVHVIVLDTMNRTYVDGMDAEQQAFMDADFRAHGDAPWRVVLTHGPPFTKTSMHAGQAASVAEFLTPICDGYRIDVVFAGHVHSYQRSYPVRGGQFASGPIGRHHFTDPHAPVYVISGTGKELYPFDGPRFTYWAAAWEQLFSYLVVRATERTLTVAAFSLPDRREIDSFTIEKTPLVPDAVPPAITGIRIERFGSARQIIRWETDEPSIGEIWCHRAGEESWGPYLASYFGTVHELEVGFSSARGTTSFDILCTDLFGNRAELRGNAFLTAVSYLRGDTNLDGEVNLADAVGTLYLAAGGSPSGLPCAAAGDVNLDGALDVADAIYLCQFLFAGGPPPPEPFPEPGPYGEDETLPCTGGFFAGRLGVRWW